MVVQEGNGSPFFSVIVPCFNRASQINCAVESVFRQTYENFEIIVVDDGSTDDLAAALAQFSDPRLQLVRRTNGGAGAARNTGLDVARGRYVSFLDSDDEFLPHHLEQTRQTIEKTPDAAVIFSQVVVDRGGPHTFLKPPRPPARSENIAVYLMCDRGFIPVSSATVEVGLARRTRFTEVRGTDEDLDFMLRLAANGALFRMADRPSARIDDRPAPGRVSGARRAEQCLSWLASARPYVGERGYFGYRGWHVAKVLAPDAPWRAFGYFLEALFRGVYRPRMVATVLLQVTLTPSAYEKLSAHVLKSKRLLAISGFRHGAE